MNSRPTTLAELAKSCGGILEKEADGSKIINGAAPLEKARDDDISFLANSKYKKFLANSRAGALILDAQTKSDNCPVIRHDNPYAAFARVLDVLYPDGPSLAKGMHKTVQIESSAKVDPSVSLGAFCTVGTDSNVGKRTQMGASVNIGSNVIIGDDCLIYPGVQILEGAIVGSRVIIHSGVVIGSDGFGFAPSEEGLEKVKQIGWVEIGDDVEIGANSTIDRGALGPTKIGAGTKIDNLVQIAHNVEIGRNCIIVAQVGISGSTKLGDKVVLAGQVGLIGHLELGDGVMVGAQSGVAKSFPAGARIFGSPARDINTTLRIEAALTRLPELLKRVKKLEDSSE